MARANFPPLRMRSAMLLLLALALPACQAGRAEMRAGIGPGGSTVHTSQVRVSTDSRLGAAIIIAIMLADGIRYFRVEPDGRRTPVDAPASAGYVVPPRVNIQDCTQPVDLEAGNLVCR